MTRPKLLLLALAAISVAFMVAASKALPAAATRLGSISSASNMLEPRSGHSATLLPDGKVLIAGGMRRNQDFYRSAELYDPATGRFTPAGDMTVQRVGHIAVLLPSGKVLIAGGWVGHGCTDSAELYDPTTRKFAEIGKMTTRRAHPSATLLRNGDVLIAGGADHDGPGSSVVSAEIFHSASLSFKPTGPMHHARVSHTATLLDDGRVLIVGGKGETLNASAELYDPGTGRFAETGSLVVARYKHTAGLLPAGRVLIAGGSDDRDWQGQLSSAEIYDLHSGKFSATSPLNESRFKLPDEAVRLASGQLLIAGGSRQVEIYDPASGNFVLASGQLSGPWHFMSETRLKDGSVLLAGGYPNNDRATAETWVYRASGR
jgi:galactose oxidase-like protein/Kelch motif protein